MAIKGKIFKSKTTGNKVKVIAENTPCHYITPGIENVTVEFEDVNLGKKSTTLSKVIFLQNFTEIDNVN